MRFVVKVPIPAEQGIGTFEQVTGHCAIAEANAYAFVPVGVRPLQNALAIFSSRKPEPFPQLCVEAGLQMPRPVHQDVAMDADDLVVFQNPSIICTHSVVAQPVGFPV